MARKNIPEIITRFNFGENNPALVKFVEDHATRCSFENGTYKIALEFERVKECLPQELRLNKIRNERIKNSGIDKAELSGDIVIALMHTGLDFEALRLKKTPHSELDHIDTIRTGRQYESGRKPHQSPSF